MGHRYLAISFMIAQSAFLCSLFAVVRGLLNKSFWGGALASRLSFGFWTMLAFSNCDDEEAEVDVGVSLSNLLRRGP